jgi:hypothetical protein
LTARDTILLVGPSAFLSFFEQRFQLRDRLQITRTTGGTLPLDEAWKVEAAAGQAEEIQSDRVRQKSS